jgi:fatty acid desaturase
MDRLRARRAAERSAWQSLLTLMAVAFLCGLAAFVLATCSVALPLAVALVEIMLVLTGIAVIGFLWVAVKFS